MTQLGKLYERMLCGTSLSFAEFQRLLEAFGFERGVSAAAITHTCIRRCRIRK